LGAPVVEPLVEVVMGEEAMRSNEEDLASSMLQTPLRSCKLERSDMEEEVDIVWKMGIIEGSLKVRERG
jgi:hypothetical protein